MIEHVRTVDCEHFQMQRTFSEKGLVVTKLILLLQIQLNRNLRLTSISDLVKKLMKIEQTNNICQISEKRLSNIRHVCFRSIVINDSSSVSK